MTDFRSDAGGPSSDCQIRVRLLCAIFVQAQSNLNRVCVCRFLFERRLIEKYIDSTGKCPVSGEELSADDLISIKGATRLCLSPADGGSMAANKCVKPRPMQATSIPGMLALFQNEWDALMLETYTLKQHLETVLSVHDVHHPTYCPSGTLAHFCELMINSCSQ